MKAIDEDFGLHDSTVSRILKGKISAKYKTRPRSSALVLNVANHRQQKAKRLRSRAFCRPSAFTLLGAFTLIKYLTQNTGQLNKLLRVQLNAEILLYRLTVYRPNFF